MQPRDQPKTRNAEIMTFSDSTEATCSVSSGSYSGGESEALSEGNSVVLLLDKLRSPVPSELAMKTTNPPPIGQRWLCLYRAKISVSPRSCEGVCCR